MARDIFTHPEKQVLENLVVTDAVLSILLTRYLNGRERVPV